MQVQWYPGHMTKTKRMILENISQVDIVIELLDARIPYSSKNPDIDGFAKDKKRIIIMNKCDLADKAVTEQWKKFFEEKGFKVILVDSVTGKGIGDIIIVSRELMKEKIERLKSKGRIFVPIRAMILGIPNVGKSTLINKFVGKSITKTGDRPGVTRAKQWVRIYKDFELMDTPGILWPKFDDKNVGLKLAFTGAINDEVVDKITLSYELISLLLETNPNALRERYKIEFDELTLAHDVLDKIAQARGFKKKGGELDIERAAIILTDEFRGAKLGRISLEKPETEQGGKNS